ncbi:MAG TPA: HlyD family secretion protein [Usitatibacter sp.]|jgi:membrane fusion protein (multidrug efflux system)|nr:HlyD family secretion protein [Usitatibacter sp.]
MAAAAAPSQNTSSQPTTPAPRRERRLRGKGLKWIVALLVLAIGAFFAVRWWMEQSRFVSTDDAYVGANQAEIAAQVSGSVTQVFVRDQQHVKKGDALFQIDPKPYQIALDRAEAQLELARQDVSQQGAGVASAEAVLAQRRAEESNARSTWERNQQLVKSGFISPQAAETSRTQLATAAAAVRAAEAEVAKAKSALGKTGDENAAVQAATAAVEQAQLDLDRTRVVSPADGVIANFTLQPGNTVQPGQPLFVVIANDEWWVDANFKETQLNDVRPGEKARVVSDVYPDHPFHGVVQSVAGGSGAAFSLLPPQNATGNWVKVTQRVPVRVRITDPDPQHPLRIGTSATVKVEKAQ